MPALPYNVFHLIKGLGRGGAEMLVAESYAFADHERFRYSYGYFMTSKGDLANELEARGASVKCFEADSHLEILLSARRVARYVRKHGVDIIHAHLPLSGVVGRLAGRLAEVPVIYTEHNVMDQYHPIVKGLCLATWGMQVQTIAISEDVAASVLSVAGERVPVQTIVDGIDTAKFAPAPEQRETVRSQLGIPNGAPVIGTVCVFTHQKRLDLWLNAARWLLDREPETHFLVVGDGPIRSELEEHAKSLKLGSALHFVGRQSDVRPFLAAMDVFLMSSAYEGFGIAPVEAMSMGIPVVSTDVRGIRTVIRDGENGLLVPFDSHVAESMGETVWDLLRDPERCYQLGNAARAAAIERFSLSRVQKEVELIYERVIAEHRGR